MSQLMKCYPSESRNRELSIFSKLNKTDLKRNYKLKKKKDVTQYDSLNVDLIKCKDCISTKNHAKLASEYKINLLTVKKHYSILTNIPKILINKVKICKKEKSPPGFTKNCRLSPVFGSKRKKISKIKTNIDSYISLSNTLDIQDLITQNYSTYIETLNSKSKEDKIFTNDLPIQKLDKKINQELHISLPETKQKKYVKNCISYISFERSQDSSDKCTTTVKSIGESSNEKTETIIKNLSSNVENKYKKYSNNLHDKEKILLIKQFGDADSLTKKIKFVKKLKKVNNKSKEISINKKNIFLNPIKVKQNDTKNKNKIHDKPNKIQKKYKQLNSSNSTDIYCPKLLTSRLPSHNKPINRIQTKCKHLSCSGIFCPNCSKLSTNKLLVNNIPESFGKNLVYQDTNTNIQNNVADTDTNTFENHKQYNNQKVDISSKANKIEEKSDHSDSSFISIDFFSDLDFDDSNKKKISNSTCDSNVVSKEDKTEKNLKIISNIMLPKNIISSPFKYSEKEKFQSKNSKTIIINSKELKSLCSKTKPKSSKNNQEKSSNLNSNNLILHHFELKDTVKSVKNLTNTFQQKSNWNVELSHVKVDINGDLKNTTDNNNIDESFDSLCQVVSKLSKNENITLYKATEDDNIVENEKIILQLTKNKIENSDFVMPIVFEKNANEMCPSAERVSKKSPITFQNSSSIHLGLESNSISKSKNITKTPQDINMLQLQQNSQNIPAKSSFISMMDLNINQSISQVKTLNLNSQQHPSVSESFSTLINRPNLPYTLVTMDNTNQNSENENNCIKLPTIADPRLRKRKIEDKIVTIDAKETTQNQHEKKGFSPLLPVQDCSLNNTKKKKLSVFERLGIKQKSTTNSLDNCVNDFSNQLFDIIENEKSIESKMNVNHDSDDDFLSLHPCERFSSDEEESNTSPRHRKFTSERTRTFEEIRNQPISIKDRLSWDIPIKNRKPFPLKTKLISKSNVNLKNYKTTEVPSLMQQVPNKHRFTGASTNAFVAVTPAIQLGDYSNNDSVFNENFYKMNTEQMLQDVNNFKTQELENVYADFGKDSMEWDCKFDYMSMLDGSNKSIQKSIYETKHYFFKSYCFRKLRKGTCSGMNDKCHYFHKIDLLQAKIKEANFNNLITILNVAIKSGFEYFLTEVWSDILPILDISAFRIYEKLYQENIRPDSFIHSLLQFCLEKKLYSVESFVKKISSIIQQGDRESVRIICSAVKQKLPEGFCWEAIKDLCQRAVPPHDIIELILIQCLKRKKNETHINEVYEMVKNKLSPIERNQISQSILNSFLNLAQRKQIISDKEALNTKPLMEVSSKINNVTRQIQTRTQSIDSIQSVDNEKQVPGILPTIPNISGIKNKINLTTSENNVSSIIIQPNNSPVEVRATTPNKGESTNFSKYVVTKIDILEPQSLYRDRFWKLYLSVHNLKEGLNHVDYEYVWKIMDEFSKEKIQDELLRRAYYHILCKNVKSCENHLSQVIKQAVRTRWSTSRKSIDILFDVGVYALIDLSNNELWVMALQLLKFVKILEPEESRTTFVLICIEIYLANNDPLEALYLLQKTQLIKSNRNSWITNDSSCDHEKHRNKLVFILLKALSYTDVDKALYLFKTIIEDQYSAHYPIDLVSYLDKLMLLFILQNKDELIADLCRIAMENHLTFRKSVYQELLSQILPVDEVLANQILDYAIHLGYYTDIQIRNGFTTLIIDMNSSEEELYLILKRLIHKLILSIGPVIEHLKPHQLKVILIFEDIPAEKRLYVNETAIIIKKRFKRIRNLVDTMLATRFTPPIKLNRKRTDKFCQIVSRTLVNYLKYWN